MVITSFTFTINTYWNVTSVKIENFTIYKYISGMKQYPRLAIFIKSIKIFNFQYKMGN